MRLEGCSQYAENSPRHKSAFSRREAPELFMNIAPLKQRVQGKPGARCTRSRAWSVVNTRVSHHRFTGTPGLPCAMVLTVSSGLSPVTGLYCHRRQWSCLHQLERQRRGVRTTRLRRPQGCALVSRAACVHRIQPRVRDDRDTPL
jgi:hypothetical protein